MSQIGAVVVIDTNTNTGGNPIPGADVRVGIAYEPVNGRMYVANSGSIFNEF
ncbi:MAG TPA: hypothetical protein VE130_09085 [Nitrososphaeraceae archaeon]|nr:hypothetical protein [Nitrososphaeraceae archaeon]